MIALLLVMAAVRYETASAEPFILLRDNTSKIEAAVTPSKGGELSSLVLDKVELIYLGRDYSPRAGFGGKAMFLWPATGPVVGNRWELTGKTLPMPFHGFAKDQTWTLVEHAADAKSAWAVLRITDTVASRESYPFGFSLAVRYELREGKLTIGYTVEAAKANTAPMPFAIGNHVAFNLPLSPAGQAGRVTFETSCRDEIVRDANSLPTGEVKAWRHAMSATPISEIHAIPAISLANCGRAATVRLKDPGGTTVDVTHRADSLPKMPVVQYNLYGAAAEGYFSPEPWIGLQGGLNSNKGLTRVAPGGKWRWTIEIKPTASAKSSPPIGYR